MTITCRACKDTGFVYSSIDPLDFIECFSCNGGKDKKLKESFQRQAKDDWESVYKIRSFWKNLYE